MAASNHTAKARGSKPAKDPIIDSLHYPLVISFGASRAAGYETALLHARLVNEYSEYGDGNALRHYCCITKTREEFRQGRCHHRLLANRQVSLGVRQRKSGSVFD